MNSSRVFLNSLYLLICLSAVKSQIYQNQYDPTGYATYEQNPHYGQGYSMMPYPYYIPQQPVGTQQYGYVPYPNYNYYNFPVQQIPANVQKLPKKNAVYYYPVSTQSQASSQTKTNPNFASGGGYPGYSSYPNYPVGQGRNFDPYANIKTEIIDVSPEYHQKLLGLTQGPAEHQYPSTGYTGTPYVTSEVRYERAPVSYQPRYIVKTDSKTTNSTNIPTGGINKVIVNKKSHSTTFKRTFVYDPTKPEEQKSINLNFLNGVLVTEDPGRDDDDDESTTTIPKYLAEHLRETTTEGAETTTESEKPNSVNSWLF